MASSRANLDGGDVPEKQENGNSPKEIKNVSINVEETNVLQETIGGISTLLNTGLSNESLEICTKLLDAGVHPQALAEVIKQMKRGEVA